MLTEQERRPPRVPFRHPVRVETMDEPRRVIRTLSANLSKDGLFLRMPEPLAEGTRLLVSLEAKGCPHALAEAEVRWATRDGVAGCGVLFTRYSHPRSKELLTHLVESIEHHRPMRIAGRPQKWRRLIATAAIALLVGGLLAVLKPTEAPARVAVAESSAGEAGSIAQRRVDPAQGEAAPLPAAGETVSLAQDVAAQSPAAGESVALTENTAAPSPSAGVAPTPVKIAPHRKHLNLTLTNVRAPAKKSATLAEALKGAPPAVTATRAPFGSTPTVAGSLRGSLKLSTGAAKALSWDVSPSAVRFAADGEVVKTMLLDSPARAVIDLKGSKPVQAETLKLAAPHVKSVRVGTLPEGTRLVIDLDKAPTSAKPAGNAIVLTF